MYITEEELNGFDNYKYSCIDSSPLSNYVMHPFWNKFVLLVPKWVAPNVLTFSGFLLLVLQYFILCYYDPDFIASVDVPIWVWWLSCFCQFFSHTLDGIDGKQARRTGSSSPLGELFDHGLDSWASSFFAFGIMSVFSRLQWGLPAWSLYSILWSVYVSFVISHWEKYNTGVLYLPWGYDFSQVGMAVVYAVTAIYGATVWQGIYVFGFQLSYVLALLLYITTFGITVPVSLYNVFLSYQNKTGKMRSFYEASMPMFSCMIAFIVFTIWGILSPGDIMNTQMRWLFFLCSVVFSNIVCRLIVSQMSNCRCQVFNAFLAPLIVAVVYCVISNNTVHEVYVLKTLTIALTVLHIHYGVYVVQQLANHFNINVFLIRSKEKLQD